jgi:hypothetical protein
MAWVPGCVGDTAGPSSARDRSAEPDTAAWHYPARRVLPVSTANNDRCPLRLRGRSAAHRSAEEE